MQQRIASLEQRLALCEGEVARLHAAEQQFRMFSDSAYDWHYWLHPDGSLGYVSPACERITGYQADEFLASPNLLTSLVHPDDQERLQQHIDDKGHSQHGHQMRFRIITRQGRERWIEHTCQPVYDAGGHWLGQHACNRDITASIQTEDAYRIIVEHALQGYIIVQHGYNIFVNAAAASITGYSSEELLSWATHDTDSIIYPADRAMVRSYYEKHLAGKTAPHYYECRIVRPDGAVRWLEVFVSRIIYHAEPAIQLAFVDNTERKQAEAMLRLQEQALATVTNGILIVDANEHDMPIIYCNATFERVTGYRANEVLGHNCRFLQGADTSQATLDIVRAALRKQQACRVTLRNYHRDGTPFWNDLAIAPMHDEHGKLTHYIGVINDITRQVQAESALQASEEKFRGFFEQSQDGLVLIAEDGKIVDWNAGAEHLLLLRRAGVIGQPHWDVLFRLMLPEQRRPETYQQLERLTLEFIAQARKFRGSDWHGQRSEHTIQRADGTWRSVSVWIFPIYTNRSLLIGSIIHDITDLKQAETALRSSQRFIQHIADTMPDLLYVYDLQTQRNIYVNQAVKSVLGYLPEQVYAMDAPIVPMLVHPDDEGGSLAAQQQRFASAREGDILVSEHRIRHADNDWRWLAIRETVFARDEHGTPTQILGVAQDSTEIKHALSALAESEQMKRCFFEQSMDGMVLMNEYASIIEWNRGARYIWGLSWDDVFGMPFWEVLVEIALNEGSNNERNALVISLQEHFGRENPTTRYQWISLETRHADGSVRFVEVQIFPIKTNRGLLFGAIVRDMTTYKQAEDALRQSKDAAEAANRAKSTFLANMSHELRTPLNAILGFTQLMIHDTRLPPDIHENLRIISQSGAHLLALINDVLEMSKIESGRMALQEQQFNLHSFIREVVNMFYLRASEKSIRLHIDQAPSVPAAVYADQRKLRQVLINLLSNAIKFTEAGSVTLRVSTSRQRAQGAEEWQAAAPGLYLLLFEVADTGVGIAPEHQQHIFEAFTQVYDKPRYQEGTGLGLPISQHFVQMMGGTLSVRSEPGKGSVFAFTLPVTLAEPTGQHEDAARQHVTGLLPGQPTYRILVVEDQEENRALLLQVLDMPGLAVREAVNGQEALEVCQAWQPHLVFMDMRMPVLDGYEATRRIAAADWGRGIVVIGLTAGAFAEDVDTILAVGCAAVLLKPFAVPDVYAMLSTHLGVQFASAAVPEPPDEQSSLAAASATDEAAPALTVEAMALLPQAVLQQLHRASLLGDVRDMQRIAESIQEQAPTLAEELLALVADFRFEQITSITEGLIG